MKLRNTHKLLLSITASILAACGAKGYELNLGTNLPPVDFHGFASQGFLASSRYNYLGDSTDGSFLFTEAGINMSFNPFPKTRITAQGFMYDVGEHIGKYDLTLDYASIEYTFNDYIGVRAGRIIRPQGIYNAIQSVDVARTFVLLPQGMYDVRWRDFYCDLDGGEFFGDLPLGKAGDLYYEAYGGEMEPAIDGGIAYELQDGLSPGQQLTNVHPLVNGGCQLWYNTPVDGLRAGFGFAYSPDFEFNLDFPEPFPPFSQVSAAEHIASYSYQASLEYLWKGWTFQAEYLLRDDYIYTVLPALLGGQSSTSHLAQDCWYVAASYQINKYLQAGAYYTQYYGSTSARGNPSDFQKDAAIALRFDPTSWWTIKAEAHCLHGVGLLQDNADNPNLSNLNANNQPVESNNRTWFMVALKTTLNF